ncbi:unnamed protein product [Phytomonas sp. EM1]|nr:unnamed protein product [Phytomonas sp. EM1]|eukprot:CCW64161.1 unnamed protein product [Phytomonas sp. isolate EM1]
MPVFSIILKAGEWEGVAAVRPSDGRCWALKCRCLTCHEVTDNYLFIDSNELCSSGGGGVRNYSSQCRFCKERVTANVLSAPPCSKVALESGNRGVPSLGSYCPDQHPEGGVVVQLDMRGAEPVELRLDEQWVVEGMSGVVFKDVDLSDDWYDYDEAAGSTVSIGGVSVSFHRVRR